MFVVDVEVEVVVGFEFEIAVGVGVLVTIENAVYEVLMAFAVAIVLVAHADEVAPVAMVAAKCGLGVFEAALAVAVPGVTVLAVVVDNAAGVVEVAGARVEIDFVGEVGEVVLAG